MARLFLFPTAAAPDVETFVTDLPVGAASYTDALRRRHVSRLWYPSCLIRLGRANTMTSDVGGRGSGLIGLVAALGLLLGAWWILHQEAGARIRDREARMEPRPAVY